MRSNQSGISIIELLIAITLATIISAVMIGITLTFYGNTIRSQIQSEMAVNGHFALRSLVEDLRLGSSLGSENALPDMNEPAEGWSTDSDKHTLIIGRPATDENDDVIYDDETELPYNNEFIYFVSDGGLKKRSLRNTSAPNNGTVTSCPEEAVSTSCPEDVELVDNVTGFSFTLIDTDNNETLDPALARSIRLTLTTERHAFGRPVIVNNTITTGLRN